MPPTMFQVSRGNNSFETIAFKLRTNPYPWCVTPLDFIGYWRAQPFRPFRVCLKNEAGARAHELRVVQPLQIAMSPNMQTVMLALDDEAVSFRVEEIERCEWIEPEGDRGAAVESIPGESRWTNAVDTRQAVTEYRADAGTPVFMSFTTTDGHRLVQVSIDNMEGRSCFTTAGTRWDIHGIETFENGCTLYLHHLDNPLSEQRVIVWPASNGTFETFAEAQDFSALYSELRARDRAFNAEPRDFRPPESYFRDIVPRPKETVYRRNWWEKDEPDDKERYIIKLGIDEVGPHHWASAPRVVDTATKEVLFDLWNTQWDLCGIVGSSGETLEAVRESDRAEAADKSVDTETSDGEEQEAPTIRLTPPWTFELRHFPDGDEVVTATLDPKSKTATIRGITPMPLSFFEQCLKNYSLCQYWEWLWEMLRAGPRQPEQPLYSHTLTGGYILELWPGPASIALPFLQFRLLEPGESESMPGRVLLDMRGSAWSADLQLIAEEPKLILEFFTGDNHGRCEYTRHALVLDLPSRRVRCERLEGSTALGVLHSLTQTARNAQWFCEGLAESFARGRMIPLP